MKLRQMLLRKPGQTGSYETNHLFSSLFQMDYANDQSTKALLTKYAEIYAEKERTKELYERRRFPLEKRLKENIVGQVSVCQQ